MLNLNERHGPASDLPKLVELFDSDDEAQSDYESDAEHGNQARRGSTSPDSDSVEDEDEKVVEAEKSGSNGPRGARVYAGSPVSLKSPAIDLTILSDYPEDHLDESDDKDEDGDGELTGSENSVLDLVGYDSVSSEGSPGGMGKATSQPAFIIFRQQPESRNLRPETGYARDGNDGLYGSKIGCELCSRCHISEEGACSIHGGNDVQESSGEETGGVENGVDGS